uniref:Uncharacterized protein n=1 Tax=Rhizophora mucronata TaxID=61149 RepID=A0A2P2QCH3_RHIMU
MLRVDFSIQSLGLLESHVEPVMVDSFLRCFSHCYSYVSFLLFGGWRSLCEHFVDF